MSSSTNMTSPQPPNPFSPDNSTFDFLQFMGLDSTTTGTSPLSTEAGPSQSKDTDDASRSGLPSRGRRPSRGGRHSRGARSGSNARENGTEVDTTGNNGTNGMVPYGPSQFLGLPKGFGGNMDMSFGGLGQSQGSIEFDANQAQLLQQQLEHIHMQSPLGFDLNNGHQFGNIGQSPFLPMAQMLLASPANGLSQLPNGLMNGSEDGNMDVQEIKRRLAMMNGYGMITPAPSGEMFPQSRLDQMSPMQLEMLARGENDLNVTPMLSPALSNQHSMQPSPANQTAFTQTPAPNAAKSPLELLQEQQRQFQEQLALLQQQQKELQATAAAVAAATSTSSSVGNSSSTPTSQNFRSNINTNFSAPPSVGSINTPSPGYFSPLTSPALESSRNGQLAQHPYIRPPHPLSALSSPALNPVGSSGGAQQTLSPALGPQSNADMSDPDYVRALIGSLDHSQDQSNQMPNQAYHSPAMNATHQFSPLVSATGTGPHRHSLGKTRPSPMMKPINHRSHGKHGSTSGNFSLPTSPAIQRVVAQAVPGMGYLPPAAIQPHYASTSGTMTSQSALSISTPSTPSPVDLNQLMPPPPVPNSSKPKGMAPMTPASLMNLGAGVDSSLSDIAESGTVTPVATGARRLGTRSAPSSVNATKTAVKRNGAAARKSTNGSRLAPNAAGKRALAMRPAGDVGVRAAIKGAAAAASLPLPEGETRKTSHKAAEQKRRDSLKAGFDELRLLLPPINTEALDPESGEPIPGSSAPRLLPKSSLVPDDNPNRGVSKVALLKFSNEYIVRLHDKVDKRDDYIERLRQEVQRLRVGGMLDEVRGPEGEDLLDMDMLDGEEDDFGDPTEDEEEGGGEDGGGEEGEEEDEEMEEDDEEWTTSRRKSGRKESLGRRPSLQKRSSSSTVKAR